MNEDFSKLSYKELQALAAKNKIPGNIKKELLVDFLEALKSGNEVQVNRMLDELRENRKRKVRKRKLERLEKMTAVTSTPMHSPNYSSIDDRFYSPQHLSPYRWTVPEEEMIKREDPNYEMFRQYLIQRIQKNYQNFDTNNNDGELDTAALNLKAGPMEFSTHQSNVFTNPTEAKSFLPSPIFETQESHSLRNINENNTNNNNNNNNNSYKPMILQKMLQAPLGTNLGAMARLEANRMWPIEHYRSLRDIDDNNSDTITADSESCDEEWNERECYNIFDNNRRSQTMFNEQNQIPQINLDQMMMNYLQNNSQNGYQINSTGNFIQENCQSWIDNSLDYRGPIDYTETADTSRIYPSYSVDEQVNNYQFQNDMNITNFGQNVNSIVENNSMQIQNMHYYPLQQQQQQQQQQQIQQFRPECYEQNHSSVICNNSSFNVNVSNSYNPVHTQDSFGIYSQDAVTTSATYSGGENFHYQNQAAQKDRNNPIDMYWPKWSDNNASDLRLENILNLSTGGSTDYTKLNQTSSVYCFAPPLSCPLSGSSSSENVERAEFVTAGRCHTFISNSLVYSDSTTDYRSDDSFQPEPIQEVWITDFNNQDGNESNDYLSTSCETIPE
ncbi:putative uncharacterized protein DDB_G0271606 isoform X2 [Leptopilina boulardi]|uniref:putative uncharacterized protein DDB_G0271606 isoform X2 n=1 Tax=Leptopilina boulardi TaxID=63433 RepID=UPI0021F545D3|nr:putative uncharacterized protein DDB_G0271606 isoform X2 [Leptopilina boulardi]